MGHDILERFGRNCASGGLNEPSIMGVDPVTAFMTVKGRRVEYVAHPGSAPWASAPGLTDYDHRAQNRGQHASNNYGNAENRAESGETKHGAHDDAHGCGNYPKQKSARRTSNGRLFRFGRRVLLLDLGWDFGPAKGTEAPRGRKMRSAFGTLFVHWRALPEGEKHSTQKDADNRTGITTQRLC